MSTLCIFKAVLVINGCTTLPGGSKRMREVVMFTCLHWGKAMSHLSRRKHRLYLTDVLSGQFHIPATDYACLLDYHHWWSINSVGKGLHEQAPAASETPNTTPSDQLRRGLGLQWVGTESPILNSARQLTAGTHYRKCL